MIQDIDKTLKKFKPHMQLAEFESPYFAAIDLGSNSFHMLVIRINDSKIEIVDREKEMVQIARGISDKGMLDESAMERALACLQRFSERLRDIPKSQIRAVGTKTLRSIQNAKNFLKKSEKVLGSPIEIVSGYEEARLVYNGLSHTVIDDSHNRLVIDIGGGSTEFVIGKGYTPQLLESLSLGCVTYTKNYFANLPDANKKFMRNAYFAACNELEIITQQYSKLGWEIAYGTSGTMKAIASLVADSDGGAVITRDSLNELAKQIIENNGVINDDISKLRRSVLPAGIAILQAIFDSLKIETLHVADSTLKEGLLYDTLGRFSDHDIRISTVEKLKVQYGIDSLQADRVSYLAKKLWQDIKGPELTGVSRTKTLNWAAQLHEIGLSISHSSYHRHGYYILRYSDLGGFGRYEQYILANLVRYHRRKIARDSFNDIDEQARPAFFPLLLCLRVACTVYRRREDLDVLPRLTFENDEYVLSFSDNFLETHPLTLSGLEKEISYFKNIGMTLRLFA